MDSDLNNKEILKNYSIINPELERIAENINYCYELSNNTNRKISESIAAYNIPNGGTYTDVIDGAIKRNSKILVLLSPTAQESEWVKKDAASAVNYKKRYYFCYN